MAILFDEEIIEGKKYLKVCPSSEVYERTGKKILFDDSDDIYQVAIFRINGNLYCTTNHCPHQNAPEIFNGVLTGKIKGGRVTCPLHGWTYNIDDGSNAEPKRGLKKLTTFEIFERDGWVYIEYPNIPIPKWRARK
jgi:nitrite reductase [NAD(P)H] small subunit